MLGKQVCSVYKKVVCGLVGLGNIDPVYILLKIFKNYRAPPPTHTHINIYLRIFITIMLKM